MKKISIVTWLIVIIVFATAIQQNYKYRQEHTKFLQCQQKLKQVQKTCRYYIANYAMISKDAIQKWNGRHILLYHPQQVYRKRKNFEKQMKKYYSNNQLK